jgi:hypothetical protein
MKFRNIYRYVEIRKVVKIYMIGSPEFRLKYSIQEYCPRQFHLCLLYAVQLNYLEQ